VHSIRTITIDLDDTLWEIGPVLRRAETRLRSWFAEHYPRVAELFPPEAVIELRQRVLAEHADQIHDLTFLRKTMIARMSAAAGYRLDIADEAFCVFNDIRNDVELFPDVVPSLASLRGRYVLIALTNGNADLERIGIRALFDDVISARAVGAAKPQRSIFDAAVSAGGARAGETLHVGDHPEHDIFGARRAGLKTVWVNRYGNEWPDDFATADAEVADMHELDALLSSASR